MNNDSPKIMPSESLQALHQQIEKILPDSKETSVASAILYFDPSGVERLMITGLRFPSGNLGQVRFDYRADKNSKLIDVDLETGDMKNYDMSKDAEGLSSQDNSLSPDQIATWLEDLMSRGIVQNI